MKRAKASPCLGALVVLLSGGFLLVEAGVRKRAAHFEPAERVSGARVGEICAGDQQLGAVCDGQRVAAVDAWV